MGEERFVTLIGTKLAKIGDEFLFLGAAKKCEECRLKHACANLEVERRYRIENVRNNIKHDCFIHEDSVSVVEVIEAPINAAIDASHAFKNAKLVFELPRCNEPQCALFDSCCPVGLKTGDRCTILNVIGDAPGDCNKGRDLKLAVLRRETA